MREIEALKQRLETENIYLQEEVKTLVEHLEIVGQKTPGIKKVVAKAQQVAQTDSTVLLLGETGTGKELLARVVHNLSRRKDRPLVIVNTASLAPTLNRKRAVRPGKRRLYRGHDQTDRPLRTGRRVHLVSGRNRRPGARTSGEAAAGTSGRAIRAVGEPKVHPGRRPDHRRYPSRSGGGGAAGQIPGRPLLPPGGVSHPHSTPSGKGRTIFPQWSSSSSMNLPRKWARGIRNVPRKTIEAFAEVFLAGQRSRTAQCHRTFAR